MVELCIYFDLDSPDSHPQKKVNPESIVDYTYALEINPAVALI